MKFRIKRIGIIFYLLTSIVLMTRCASTGFLMAKPKVILFGETYAPKNEDAKIDVYVTSKPSREYTEFARITCGDTNDKWCLEQITKKARQIGADGIVIVGKVGTSGVGIPVGYSTYVVSEAYGMTAIAIKYK